MARPSESVTQLHFSSRILFEHHNFVPLGQTCSVLASFRSMAAILLSKVDQSPVSCASLMRSCVFCAQPADTMAAKRNIREPYFLHLDPFLMVYHLYWKSVSARIEHAIHNPDPQFSWVKRY